MIEYLRHIIVHNRGNVPDKNIFKEDVLKDAGLYNNGKPDSNYLEEIDKYFGVEEYGNTICLLPLREIPGLSFKTTVFENLSKRLMAYAYIVYESLSKDS